MADVQTLANVDIEGVWVFSKQRDLHSLVQLRGLRVAAGPAGSGHRVLAQRAASSTACAKRRESGGTPSVARVLAMPGSR